MVVAVVEHAERVLQGGTQTDVREAGGVVFRSPGPQSPTIMALLRHLDQVGFTAAPRPIGEGFAPDGREMLSFIVGESPQPHAWSDDAVHRIGQMLAELHVATDSFDVPADARWRPWFARDLRGGHPVIGHGDLGPWNILAVDGRPTAFIDWDNAGPVDAVWELAQVAWQNAQLHDDDVAEQSGLPDAAAERGSSASWSTATGSNAPTVSASSTRWWSWRSAAPGKKPSTTRSPPASEALTADGFPIMWAITWRSRAAAWMLEHRALLVAIECDS